jgi:LPXTG-motif cell wall-anchored protein
MATIVGPIGIFGFSLAGLLLAGVLAVLTWRSRRHAGPRPRLSAGPHAPSPP